MGGVVSPFDPSGATEGQTLTNTCQTKLLGNTKDKHYGPIGFGPGGETIEGVGHTLTHTYRNGAIDRNTAAVMGFEEQQI